MKNHSIAILKQVHAKIALKKRTRGKREEGERARGWERYTSTRKEDRRGLDGNIQLSVVFIDRNNTRPENTAAEKINETLATSWTWRFAHFPLAEMILFNCEVWTSTRYVFMDLFSLSYSSSTQVSVLAPNNQTSFSKVIKFLRVILLLDVLGL